MSGTIVRRSLLRSALIGGAVLLSSPLALAAGRNTRTALANTKDSVSKFAYDIETLLKYAGEFGGSVKKVIYKGGSLNGRI
jgi:hypothetical protein